MTKLSTVFKPRLELCPDDCDSGIKELSGHSIHCPYCNEHLTSLLLCPKCGIRYAFAVRNESKETCLIRMSVIEKRCDEKWTRYEFLDDDGEWKEL